MIEGWSAVGQAFLGTLFTWGVTALGAALVWLVPAHADQALLSRVLRVALGFSAGVMLAATFWSLLMPAFEFAEQPDAWGEAAWFPVTVGFAAGALFVNLASSLLPEPDAQAIATATATAHTTATPTTAAIATAASDRRRQESMPASASALASASTSALASASLAGRAPSGTVLRRHRSAASSGSAAPLDAAERAEGVAGVVGEDNRTDRAELAKRAAFERRTRASWRRILMVVVAITVHNIPEGGAVGVAFGGIGRASTSDGDVPSASVMHQRFLSAKSLAWGIGLQNFPEGLAVSLPLMKAGFSRRRAFWYGQLSGMVEPFAGVLGAALVSMVEPALPFALAFAGGAMVYVVVNDLIPEAHAGVHNNTLTSWGVIVGFLGALVWRSC